MQTGWTEIQLKADAACGIPEQNIVNVIKVLQLHSSVNRNITVKQGENVISAAKFLEKYEQQKQNSETSPLTVTGSPAQKLGSFIQDEEDEEDEEYNAFNK